MAETIEETYESAVTRKVVRTSLKIEEKSSSTKTTTMTTPAKLYGRELSTYDEVDVDELLSKLSQEELTMLAKEVDPDDNFLPPSQRNNYDCEKDPTGPLNRKKLIEHINKQALETPDRPEVKPFVAGVIRGKKWIPPPPTEKVRDAEEQITIDLGDEYEQALTTASQEEIIDLAAILGFHSMMNQDQYHASLLNKGQPVGLGWDGITKATKSKVYPMDPPNDTDPDDTITRVKNNDQKLTDLNWNNIKNISDEKFERLFEAVKSNTSLEVLSLVNVGLNDRTAALLADALRVNSALRVVNVETNFISPAGVLALLRALLDTRTVEEFRASNQRSQVLGNKIEMEITSLVEQNPTLLRLGMHLEYSDARHRIASHLQRNIDRSTPDFRSEESDSSSGSALHRSTAEATKTLAEEWERIERTLYNEEGEKSVRSNIIEECKQWRQLHPQLRVVGKALQLPDKRLSCRQIEHDEVVAMHYSDYEEFSEIEERLSQSSTDVTPQNSPRTSVEDLGEHKLAREKLSLYPTYNDEYDLPGSFCSLLQITPIHIRSPSHKKKQNPSILRSELASSRWMRNQRPDSSINCDRNSAKSFVSLDTKNYGHIALSASDRNAMLNNRVGTARHRDLARLEPLCTPDMGNNELTRISNGISPNYNIRKVSLPPLLLEEEKNKVTVGSAKKHNMRPRKKVTKSFIQFDRIHFN